MPIYEYRCSACRTVFEKLRPMTESDLTDVCPECGTVSDRIMSKNFSWKWDNIFTRDGEGFTTVHMSKQEEKERIRANAGKYD